MAGSGSLASAATAVAERNPGHGPLDERALARLAEVVADPNGTSWMEGAGLLDGDSCGYPMAGGYYDSKDEIAAGSRDPAVQERVLASLVAAWADDFVLTGRARLDRSWRDYL